MQKSFYPAESTGMCLFILCVIVSCSTGKKVAGYAGISYSDVQYINDKDVTGPLRMVSTYDQRDTIAWRQWHHWNYLDHIAEIDLKKGRQVLTLHTVANGQMNYDYLNFEAMPGE